MNNFKLKSFDNKELNCYLFDEVENPVAVIQIIHGMKEHSKRYFDFISFLNKNNFIVFINDLRGHGLTESDINNLGYSEGDIYQENLSDQLFISSYLHKKYNDLPLYIFSHSFGSFIGQGYILKNEFARKIVLCGSSYNNTLLFNLANILAKTLKFFRGKRGSAKFIEKLSFDSYSKKFKNGNWLTRNEKVFQYYLNDEYCGTPFPISFYCNMFSNTRKNYKNLKKLKNKSRLFIIAGTDDPVGNFGKSVIKLSKVYQKNGFKVITKLYEGYRHELLNELNYEEVTNDLVTYLHSRLN